MMDWISDLDALHALYGIPGQPAMAKALIPDYRAFITARAPASSAHPART